MICVECGQPVNDVYREFSHGNIRLTRCERCGKYADKYVEYEVILIVLDLFLQQPQVYRHLLFNRTPYRESGLGYFFYKLAFLSVLFECYLKWFRLKTVYDEEESLITMHQYPSPYERYWHLFLSCLGEYVVYCLGIVASTKMFYHLDAVFVKYNYLVMAIILAGFGRFLLVLMMIWDYHISFSTVVNAFVLSSNVTAVKVFLDTTTVSALMVIGGAYALKVAFQLLVYFHDSSMLLYLL
eukprot:GFYU01009826.1.p1 GENE.GFYU01009826.1~~GFYU01009826.1.p1  ORF type:complete len:240 (-),score=24.03 GFYU01009826.1:178-897(-)